MSEKPTATDAELLLKLYELRREPEMRKARNWWLTQFWPNNADDILKIGNAMGSQENNWLRQVGGYWEMAASLVLHGTLSAELFLEPSFSGEMFFFFGKFRPFLNEFREKLQNPRVFANVEKLILSSSEAQQFLKTTEERIAKRREAIAEAALAKAS
jgi:hypothetical protein